MSTLLDLKENQKIANYTFIRWAERVVQPWDSLYKSLRVLGYDAREDHAPSWSK